MAVTLDMRACGLLAARLCHDLAGPIAAIGNGAELLDDDDPDFAKEAAALIAGSARTASRRLQLFRFVYGFSQGAVAGPPPQALIGDFFAGGQIDCTYAEPVCALPLDAQKLGCALLLLGGEALPRGGRLVLSGGAGGIALEASGEGAGLSPEMCAAVNPAAAVEALTSRTVSGYFAAKLAEAIGWRLALTAEPGRLWIAAGR